MRRNISSCPTNVKAQTYKALVRPILEYASPAWDPHTITNIKKLEAVQRRAARFVHGDYKTTSSTSDMIGRLQWPSLQQRREHAKLVMVYKISHSLIDIPAVMYLHPIVSSTRGHSSRYMQPYCRTDIYRHSFFSIWYPPMELIARSHSWCPDHRMIQVRTGRPPIDLIHGPAILDRKRGS